MSLYFYNGEISASISFEKKKNPFIIFHDKAKITKKGNTKKKTVFLFENNSTNIPLQTLMDV
jgi:hypothetical protein